jgi:hypothetical protein
MGGERLKDAFIQKLWVLHADVHGVLAEKLTARHGPFRRSSSSASNHF